MKPFYLQLRPVLLTLLGLGVGYLTISMPTALLYSVWLSGEGHAITSQFLAFAAICGLGFSALSGYLTALVAQRAPLAHAGAFCLMLAILWGLSTFSRYRAIVYCAIEYCDRSQRRYARRTYALFANESSGIG
ncbi:MAG: hypothetical protein HC800_04130 [Phormidesmis sp. RL_2_1]|nr:hypothetical protein [Phormidesmis sp. RL_2_1]